MRPHGNTITSAVERHPLVWFFVLAYVISWSSFYILSGPVIFPFGAVIAALVVAGLTRGTDGLKDLLSRCGRWRVGFKWYAAAILVPAAIALITVSLTVLLGAPMPAADNFSGWYSVFLMFPMVMIDAPLWEDSGWRGFAMPQFPAERSRLANTLILGLLLAGWHLPIALSGGSRVVPYLIATIFSAVITNWVYYNARESALLAIIYHTAANTAGLFLFPMFPDEYQVNLYWLLATVNFAAALIIIFFGKTYRQKPERN